jgi:ABC-type uncharacterized transport system substrate-binding protein
VKRRELITLLGGVAASWPFAARGQHSKWRIGFLGAASASGYESQIAGLRSGLAGLGYVEGENITIEYRWADGHYDRLPALVSELVLPKVGVIVTQGTPGAPAAKQGSGGIPVVMAVLGDPVATG